MVARLGVILELAEGVVPDDVVDEGGEEVAEQPPNGAGAGSAPAAEVESDVDREVAGVGAGPLDLEDEDAAAGEAVLDAIDRQLGRDDVLQGEAEG